MITGPGDKKATGHVRGSLRASYADREQAVEALKDAFAQGRLDKDELDGRLGQAFASRTYAELAAVTADIPTGSARAEPPPKPVQARARPQVSADVKAGVRAIAAIYLTAGVFWLGAALAGDNGVGGAFVYLAFMVSVVAIFFTLHGTVVLLRSLSDKRPASQGRVHRYTALLCGAPDPEADRDRDHHERDRYRGRYQGGPAQPGHREQLHPVGRVRVRAQHADRQVDHGPRRGPMLVKDVEHLLAVALPPAPRMPGDKLAGQPVGQRLPHHEPHAIPVRSRTTRTISCIVVTCSASTT